MKFLDRCDSENTAIQKWLYNVRKLETPQKSWFPRSPSVTLFFSPSSGPHPIVVDEELAEVCVIEVLEIVVVVEVLHRCRV